MSRESISSYARDKDKYFPEGVAISILHSHIKNGIPTATLLGITLDSNDLIFDFQNPLSDEELKTMDECISSYVYSQPIDAIRQILSVDMNATTNNERYETFNRVIFPGTLSFEIPSGIKFIAKKDRSVTTYSLRIIDQHFAEKENVICEMTDLDNDDDQVVTCDKIENLSTEESIWYIQGKINGGSGNIYVYNAHINFD